MYLTCVGSLFGRILEIKIHANAKHLTDAAVSVSSFAVNVKSITQPANKKTLYELKNSLAGSKTVVFKCRVYGVNQWNNEMGSQQ